MPIQDLNQYGKLLKQNQQKNQIDFLKQDNESKKIQIDLLKTLTEKELSDVEAQKIKTETLGLETDNKQKKNELLEFLKGTQLGTLASGASGLLNPANQAENQRATADAKKRQAETRKASDKSIAEQLASLTEPAQPSKPSKPSKPTKQAVLEPEMFSEGQRSSLPSTDLIKPDRLDLPPPPVYDTADAVRSLEESNKAIKEGIEFRNRIFKQREVIKDNFLKAKQDYVVNMRRNMDLQQTLSENPPTYRQALADVDWFSKILSVVNAGMYGDLHENPTMLLDDLVNRELADQQSVYASRLGYLKNEQSMYQQFYNLSKDELEAESSTLAVLYSGVADQIESYAKIATNEQQLVGLKAMSDDMRRKSAMEEMKIQQNAQTKAYDLAMKKIDLDMKKLEYAQVTMPQPAGSGANLSPTERTDRRVDFAGQAYYDIPKGQLDKKEGVRQVIKAGRRAVEGSYGLEKVGRSITKGDAFKSFFAGAPFTDFGEKERQKFETLNKGLIKLMLKSRIDFTGGGNMSQQEQAFLRQFYEVKEGRFVLKNTQKVLKIVMGLGRGDYDTLFKIVRKDAFFNSLTEMEQSPMFNMLPKAEKYKMTAKDLGFKSDEWTRY